MREWLGDLQPGSLLILDEAHHAAPSSGGRYGIETKFTRAVRDLSQRFEHRLFLSATPHNGHSNSFSTLLELLDPYRFTRGVKVRKGALGEVMVRRLKEDIRATRGGFPKRNVCRLVIDGLPENAPELILSNLLDEYRSLREERHASASDRARAAAGLLVVGLQQRLLSSIEAFARSLRVHRRPWSGTGARGAAETGPSPPSPRRRSSRSRNRPAPTTSARCGAMRNWRRRKTDRSSRSRRPPMPPRHAMKRCGRASRRSWNACRASPRKPATSRMPRRAAS